MKKNRLELTWVGKEKVETIEPRILLEDSEKSYGDTDTDNILIHGDNLLGLKALEQKYSGKVKCIYIDPPYNTGSAFEYYDDNLEHSIWLSLMRDRLVILRNLLSDDGFIFVQIDDNEQAYLKVLLDEIFGRQNYINQIVWKRRGGSANPSNRLNNVTDYILWYAKTPNIPIIPVYSKDDENTQNYIKERFKYEINGKKYMLAPVERNAKLGMRETMRYEYNGYIPKYGWMMSKENLEKLDQANKLHWNSKGRPNRRVFLDEYEGQPISSLWTDIFVINPMAAERTTFDGGQKPEALIRRILQLSTKPGDLVLDSFLGSGTTCAVAHKMNRKWIGIEMGDHVYSHCIPRINNIIDGNDYSGITDIENWTGGGGYKFYELAPSLINEDIFGEPIINKDYNPEMLARAVALHEGFEYEPDKDLFWKQSKGNENSYLYVTTQFIDYSILEKINNLMEQDEYLIIACTSYDEAIINKYKNIMIKKIPETLLNKCKYNVENYNLNVINNIEEEEEVEDE